GRTWSRPSLVSAPKGTSDKDMVIADRRHPGLVYVAYDNSGFGLVPPPRGANKLIVARSTDHGRHWRRTVVAHFPQDRSYANSQLTILRSGTLVLTAAGPDKNGDDGIKAWRSTDRGHSWRGPFQVAQLSQGSFPSFCGKTARGVGEITSAMAHVGPRSLAIVINDAAAAAHGGKLLLAESRDGGRSWHSSRILRSSSPLLLASIAGHPNGRVGVVYDKVNASGVECGASPKIPTRSLVTTSRNQGRTWSRSALVGPRWFNMADSLVGSQYFLGDYQNIVASRGGFTTATVQGRALRGHDARGFTGRTGVVVARQLMH
ncbi:MAG: repeat-like domain, partial [Nocardioidaceae bacterium]|nr:repeat-like domain [Nocardioidaceae bacterium]